jgi:hypothetical protein
MDALLKNDADWQVQMQYTTTEDRLVMMTTAYNQRIQVHGRVLLPALRLSD